MPTSNGWFALIEAVSTHAAFPAPPQYLEEGKAVACAGGLFEWHAEAQRPTSHNSLLHLSNKFEYAEGSCCPAVEGQLLLGLQQSSTSVWHLLKSS